MYRPFGKNVYKLTAGEMAEALGKSAAVVHYWRSTGKLPHNPDIRARYIALEQIVAGPGFRLKRKLHAKRKAKLF